MKRDCTGETPRFKQITVRPTLFSVHNCFRKNSDFRVWSCKNHLTVHTGKTVAMLISSHAFVGPLRPLMFGNSCIHLSTINKSTIN